MSKGVVLGGYQISNALIAIGAVLIVLAGAYTNFSVDTSSTDQKQGLDVSIQQEEVQPGDTIRVKASFNEEPAEDADIFANGEQVGKTNQNGISGYSVPESLEGNLTLRAQYQGEETTLEASFEDGNLQVPTQDDSDDTGDSQDDQQDGTQDDSDNQDNQDSQDDQDGTQDTENETYDNEPGFQLQNDPTANELNSLNLYLENGAPAENTNVYIDNNQIGTTTSSGSLTFTVPNKQEITLSTDADVDSETYEVQGYTNETDSESGDEVEAPTLDAAITTSGEEVTGQEITFSASNTNADNSISSYEWTIINQSNDNTLKTAEGETTSYTFQSSGSKTIQLDVEDSENYTDSEYKYIDISQATMSNPFISQLSPRDSIPGPKDTFSAYIEAPSNNYQYTIQIGQNTEAGPFTLNSGSNDISKQLKLNDSGDVDYTVQVTDTQTGDTYSETQSISVGRAWGEFAEVEFFVPEDGAQVDYETTFNTSLENVIAPIYWRLYVDGSLVEEKSFERDYSGRASYKYGFEQTGNHQWRIELENRDTGEIKETETKTIEAESTAPFITYSGMVPEDGEGVTSRNKVVYIALKAHAYESASYTFYVNGTEAASGSVSQGFDGYIEGSYGVEVGQTYTWWSEFESGDGETIKSDENTFTVTDNEQASGTY